LHLWLKYQVFLRLINFENKFFKENKTLASMITFSISAVWHGFYPVYYIFFIQFYLIEQSSKIVEERLNFFTRLKKMNIMMKLIFNFILMSILSYLGISFALLTISNVIKFYGYFYFIPNFIIMLVYVYTNYFIKSPKIKN